MGLVGCGSPSWYGVMAIGTSPVLFFLVFSIAADERISYCVCYSLSEPNPSAEETVQPAMSARTVYLKCDSISLLQGTCLHYTKFHAPRWLFLVFRLRRIAFLQDTLWLWFMLEMSLIQIITELEAFVLFISWGIWSKAGFFCCL